MYHTRRLHPILSAKFECVSVAPLEHLQYREASSPVTATVILILDCSIPIPADIFGIDLTISEQIVLPQSTLESRCVVARRIEEELWEATPCSRYWGVVA